jgi:hypothetical protein
LKPSLQPYALIAFERHQQGTELAALVMKASTSPDRSDGSHT